MLKAAGEASPAHFSPGGATVHLVTQQDIQQINERLHILRQEAAQARLVASVRRPSLLRRLWDQLHREPGHRPSKPALPVR